MIKKEVIVLHTYGLGDTVMLSPALFRYYPHIRDIYVLQPVSKKYLDLLGIKSRLLGYYPLLKQIFLDRKYVVVVRSSGGAGFKNHLLKLFCNALGVEYIYSSIHVGANKSLSICNRASSNMLLMESVVGSIPLARETQINECLLNVYKRSFKKKCIWFSSVEDLEASVSLRSGDLLFHFGSGDRLLKSLTELQKLKILEIYSRIYQGACIKILVGPRDLPPSDEIIKSFPDLEIINSSGFHEMMSMSASIDLVVCNDTGMGHFFSGFGVSVDLCVNRNNLVRMQDVLPMTIKHVSFV